MTVRIDDEETTVLDDPIETAFSEAASRRAAGAPIERAWPDALGFCAAGEQYWIERLESVRARGCLPPDVVDGVDQTIQVHLRPAAALLAWMAGPPAQDSSPDA